MSRLTQGEIKENPSKGMIQWKSELNEFTIYNKVTKENVPIKKPFRFVILESDYCSFNGFNKEAYKGFWSNEVKNPTDLVTVKLGNETVAEFAKQDWNPKDINKPKVSTRPELKGCKYTQILYIAAKLEGDLKEEIYRLMLNGSPLTGGITKDPKTKIEQPGQEKDGWIRFLGSLGDRNAVYKYRFSITTSKSKKNDAVKYQVPVFEADILEQEEGEGYLEMSREVDEWFKHYNNLGKVDNVATAPQKAYAEELPFDEN